MTTISKTIYSFTVLHPSDQPPADINDALDEAEQGNAVGSVTEERTYEVPDDEVSIELRKLGNDGAFFEDELHADEHDELSEALQDVANTRHLRERGALGGDSADSDTITSLEAALDVTMKRLGVTLPKENLSEED